MYRLPGLSVSAETLCHNGTQASVVTEYLFGAAAADTQGLRYKLSGHGAVRARLASDPGYWHYQNERWTDCGNSVYMALARWLFPHTTERVTLNTRHWGDVVEALLAVPILNVDRPDVVYPLRLFEHIAYHYDYAVRHFYRGRNDQWPDLRDFLQSALSECGVATISGRGGLLQEAPHRGS